MADEITQLETGLVADQNPRERIDTLNALAWSLRHTEPSRALSLSDEADTLSASGEFATEPYDRGHAASLTTRAFLNHHNAKLDIALAQCFEAVALLDKLPASHVSIDCRRIIIWIYYFLGDQSSALNYGFQALRLAQELNLRVQEAAVLDALAMVHASSGDPQQALQDNESALEIARSADDPLLESTVLNNRAGMLLGTGDTEEALECALQSLQLAREVAVVRQEVTVIDTVGDILVSMGDFARAETYLLEGCKITAGAGMELGQIYNSLSLGRLCMKIHDLDRAHSYLRQALTRATSSGTKALEAECHLRLAGVFEGQGDWKQALEHHKAFYELHEQANNETASKRLAALRVAHQVETAQRDTEIFRLRNVDLQREIEVRNRVEAELERLANTDPLTDLYNRRHFFELAQREYDRAVRYGRALTVLMVDLDHFKAINDSHGHATGDQVLAALSATIRRTLRGVDVVGRYGGEEFCIAMAETDAESALPTAERLRQCIESERFETSAGGISMTISIGLATFVPGLSSAQCTLDKLLGQADQALYRAKRAGRNRVETAPPDE